MVSRVRGGPLAVAIPVRDEVDRIGSCLEALDNQVGARLDQIVLLVNNSTDGTAAAARAIRLHPSTHLHVIERTLPMEQANAGHARRLAMDAASALVSPGGILLTTDADGLVDQDWVSATLDAFEAGADAVAGWVELHPVEWGLIPARLHEIDAQECTYDALCDEIHARLDPDPADPWPRHTQASGASIAVSAAAFRHCGGVPAIACGEDRALVAALRRIDARIRHAPEVHATVSGRTVGRAAGGMADTIRRRLLKPDEFLDARLEPALDCARRAATRARLRALYNSSFAAELALLSHSIELPEAALRSFLRAPYFGEAWQSVEAASPVLRPQMVATSAVATETTVARGILAKLTYERAVTSSLT